MTSSNANAGMPPVAKPTSPETAVAPQPRTVLRAMLIVCALAGLGLSALLALMSADPGAGWASGLCSAGDGFGCGHALSSSAATVIGPFKATHLGLAYFGIHLLWYLIVGIPNRQGRSWQLLIVLIGVAGLFGSLTYTAIMIWRLPTICQFCLTVHVVNLAMVVLGMVAWFKPRIDVAPVARPTRGVALGTLGSGFGFAIFAVVAAVGYQNQQAAFRLQTLYMDVVNDAEYIVWDWSRQDRHEIAVSARDQQIGPTDAPHTLVVFSDFDCDKCAGFHGVAEKLVSGFAPDIRIVFKHYPVSQQCNPYVDRAFHPQACTSARVFIAAQRIADEQQVKDLANLLYQNRTHLYTHEYLVNAVGLDWSAIEKQMQTDQSIDAQLQGDIEMAHDMGVDGTPTFFLNGQRLSRWMITTPGPQIEPDYQATNKLWETLLGRAMTSKASN